MLPEQLRVLDGVGRPTPVEVPVVLPKPPVTLGIVVPVLLAPPGPPVCVELPAPGPEVPVPVGLKRPSVCVELPEPGREPPVPAADAPPMPEGACPVAWIEATPPGTELDVVTPPPSWSRDTRLANCEPGSDEIASFCLFLRPEAVEVLGKQLYDTPAPVAGGGYPVNTTAEQPSSREQYNKQAANELRTVGAMSEFPERVLSHPIKYESLKGSEIVWLSKAGHNTLFANSLIAGPLIDTPESRRAGPSL